MADSFLTVLTITLLVTIIFSSAESSEEWTCIRNQYCVCSKPISVSTYELSCMWGNVSVYIEVHQKDTLIRCEKYMLKKDVHNVSWTDLVLGLDLARTGNNILTIENCPIPEISFHELFRSMKLLDVVDALYFHSKRVASRNGQPETEFQPYHFDDLPNVSEVYLQNNQLTRIASDVFRGLTNLKHLYLGKNKISLLQANALAIPSLEQLYIGENQLTALDPTTLANCTKLRSLITNSNKLGNSLSRRHFRNVRKLRSLDISSNNVTELPTDIFEDLPSLVELNLNGNNISSLPAARIFGQNAALQKIRLCLNRGPLSLPPRSFADLPSLIELALTDDNLTVLPNDLLWGSRNLSILELTGNNLKWLPKDLFKDAGSLTKLCISRNELTDFNDTVFHPLVKLKKLSVCNNRLNAINANVFSTLRSVTHLYLSNNKLERIDAKAFNEMRELRHIDMSNNALTITEYNSPLLSMCINLEEIILSKNHISVIPSSWSETFTKMRDLKLDHNNFTEYRNFQFVSPNVVIDVTDNNISTVDIGSLEFIAASQCDTTNNETTCPDSSLPQRHVEIRLNGNPLNCDCRSYHLARYFQRNMSQAAYKYVKFKSAAVLCSEPDYLKGTPLEKIDLAAINCQLKDVSGQFEPCPAQCKCFFRPIDNAAIANCSNAQLTQVPSSLPYGNFISHIEVILANNEIASLSSMADLPVYKNVTKFDLSHNRVDRINMSQFSSKLQVLNLDNNRFTYLDNDTLTVLNTSQYLEHLTLHGNPWQCNCDTPPFTYFLHNRIKQIPHLENITCKSGGQQIIKLSIDDLCPISRYTFIAGIGMATFGLIFGALVALYYRYQQEIRVWLFTHKLCLWLVAEKEIDQHKKYDAFISYSHMDESFVVEHLVPRLEKGESPFKLCLHYRDWIPGEFILNQIVASVENSRRTIVVLSPNFLNSIWGKMEFRTAHLKAMKEGCARVIIILYADVNIKKLDAELKVYVTTNTYLKWGDPWFWNKLRYALPHPPEYCKQQLAVSTSKSSLSINRKQGRSSSAKKNKRKSDKNLVPYTKSNIAPIMIESSSEQKEKIRQLNKLYSQYIQQL